jgi:hypothetical protein
MMAWVPTADPRGEKIHLLHMAFFHRVLSSARTLNTEHFEHGLRTYGKTGFWIFYPFVHAIIGEERKKSWWDQGLSSHPPFNFPN